MYLNILHVAFISEMISVQIGPVPAGNLSRSGSKSFGERFKLVVSFARMDARSSRFRTGICAVGHSAEQKFLPQKNVILSRNNVALSALRTKP